MDFKGYTMFKSSILSERARTWIIRLAILAPFIVFPIYWVKVLRFTGYCDFDVYYKTALRLKDASWDLVYNVQVDGSNPFRYSPFTLLFFRAFAELPFAYARSLFYFMNFAGFALGYLYLRRTFRLLKLDASLFVSIILLFNLRYMFDSFTIGQVSGLMFAGFSIALFYFVSGEDSKAGNALLIPSLFKLTPSLLYGLFRWTAIRTSVLTTSVITLATLVFIGGLTNFEFLFKGYLNMLRDDDTYFDSSHYASQSLKSALLRFGHKTHLLSNSQVNQIWMAAVFLGTLAILYYWNSRKPLELRAKLTSFSIGILAYLLFMPQTFKYSLGFLAFPMAALLTSARFNPFSKTATPTVRGLWLIYFLVLGVGGKDVIGDYLFFGIQKLSLPFFCIVSMLLMILRDYRQNHVSQFKSSVPEPFMEMPNKDGNIDFSILVVGTENEIQELSLQKNTWLPSSGSVETIEINTTESRTRGLAFRKAFFNSRGKTLIIVNPRQIILCDFFARALGQIDQGASLVRANRRLNESEFRTPWPLLKVAYRRHLTSKLINRFAQWLLPVESTDLFSGNMIVTRALAYETFVNQTSSFSTIDIEFDLQAKGRGFRQVDLKAKTLYLHERSVEYMLIEGVRLVLEIVRLRKRVREGFSSPSDLPLRITSDDWGISPGVNEGILDLARRGVVRRISILVTGAHVHHRLDELKQVSGLEFGLHFDLTYQNRRGPGIALLHWVLSPALHRDAIDELQTQIARIKKLGLPISYLDGHHHIHLLPGFISQAAPVLKREKIEHVRIPYDPALWFSAKAPLNILATLAKWSCSQIALKSHRCLYPKAKDFKDPSTLRLLLSRYREFEIIVHPAVRDDFKEYSIADPFSAGRVLEYRALRQAVRS